MMTIAKGFLIFLLMIVTLSVNADDGIITRLGIDFSYALVALVAFLVALLILHQTPVMVGLVVCFSLVANMPGEFVLNFGLDRDLYLGIGAALVLLPFASRVIE